MNKYHLLWEYLQTQPNFPLTLTFDQIARIANCQIDHSFLQCKKQLLAYGLQVKSISLKNKTVLFDKVN